MDAKDQVLQAMLNCSSSISKAPESFLNTNLRFTTNDIDTAQAYFNEEGVGNAWRKTSTSSASASPTTK